MSRMKLAALALLGCALLSGAAGALALRCGHWAAWRLAADDRRWVDRTLEIAPALSGRSREDFRRSTRPRVWRPPGQVCVILRSHRRHGDGSYQACFDRRTGHVIEQRVHGPSFGPTPMTDALWELVW